MELAEEEEKGSMYRDGGDNETDFKPAGAKSVSSVEISNEEQVAVLGFLVNQTKISAAPVDVNLRLLGKIKTGLPDRKFKNRLRKLYFKKEYSEIANAFIAHNYQFKSIHEISKHTRNNEYLTRLVFKAYTLVDFERIRRLLRAIIEGEIWAGPWLVKKILGFCIVKNEYMMVKTFCEASRSFREEYNTEYAIALASTGNLDYSEQIFFRQGGAQDDRKPGRNDYYLYLAALFRHSKLSEAISIYCSFVGEGHPRSIILVNEILSRLVYENLCDQAHEFYQLNFEQDSNQNPDISRYGPLKPNQDTFAKLVNGFTDQSQPSLSRMYLDKMYDLGMTSPIQTQKIWEHLLHMTVGDTSLKKKESAVILLGYMRSKFPSPPSSRSLSAHAFLSKILSPEKLEKRHNAGRDTLVPLLWSFGPTAEITRCKKSYMLVAHHLSELEAHHLFPTLIDTIVKIEGEVFSSIFVVVLRSCFAADELEVTNAILSRLEVYDVFLTRRLYSCIVYGLYRTFRVDAAVQMYIKMREAGHSPILDLAMKFLLVLKRNDREDMLVWLIKDTLGHSDCPGRLTSVEISKFEGALKYHNLIK